MQLTSRLGFRGRGPTLDEVELLDLTSLLPLETKAAGRMVATMPENHWWDYFATGAFESGSIILILDREDRPLRAFRRRVTA